MLTGSMERNSKERGKEKEHLKKKKKSLDRKSRINRTSYSRLEPSIVVAGDLVVHVVSAVIFVVIALARSSDHGTIEGVDVGNAAVEHVGAAWGRKFGARAVQKKKKR